MAQRRSARRSDRRGRRRHRRAGLASDFTSQGSTLTRQGFVDGLVPAVWIGAAVLSAGALLALECRAAGRLPPRSPPLGPVPEISAS